MDGFGGEKWKMDDTFIHEREWECDAAAADCDDDT